MKDYTPTIEQGEHAYIDGLSGTSRTRAESAAEYRRMIAEVERKAAEKAWDRCVGEMPIDPDWKNFYGDNNPYRREETE